MERRQLVSWKEIAQYLGYGVRTVQRYELNLGLPIHRPGGREKASVLAFSDELDFWLRSTPLRSAVPSGLDAGHLNAEGIPDGGAKSELIDDLHRAQDELKRAIAEYEHCLARYNSLKESLAGKSKWFELLGGAHAGKNPKWRTEEDFPR